LISVLIWDFMQHIGSLLQTLQHNLSVPSSRGKQSNKTSDTNYQSTLCRILEEHRSHLHCGGSLKSCTEISW
jgi:hypothetical protein